MANQTQVSLIDDIDGKKAHETVLFSLDGAGYEIDLTKKNAAILRKAMAEFVAVARPVNHESPSRAVFASKPAKAKTKANIAVAEKRRLEIKAMREWAAQAGLSSAKRGRIPAALVAQYQAAQAV